jgi:predicted hotdog family 3-hydroxylacyl-ACP dehydratase
VAESGRVNAQQLLPHSATALLLTAVIRSDATSVEATATVPAAHPLATGGRVPCFVGLEIGAQAAAALEAIVRGAQSGAHTPRAGYLVSVRTATFLSADLPVDTALTVTACLEGAAWPLAIYRIAIAVAGVEFLAATLSTHSGTSVAGSIPTRDAS